MLNMGARVFPVLYLKSYVSKSDGAHTPRDTATGRDEQQQDRRARGHQSGAQGGPPISGAVEDAREPVDVGAGRPVVLPGHGVGERHGESGVGALRARRSRRPEGAAMGTEDPRIEELRRRREASRLGGGVKAIERQHDRGKLTARERIDALLDAGLLQHAPNNFAAALHITGKTRKIVDVN